MLYRFCLALLAVLALAALTRYTHARHAPVIQAGVLAGAQSALSARPGHALAVVAEGRDLLLEGTVPATGALQTIQRALMAIPGVRTVSTVGVRQGGDRATFDDGARFSSRIFATRDGMQLAGDAPSRAARARAQALLGGEFDLSVNPAGDDAWMDLVLIVNRYRRQFDRIEVDYAGTTATVVGDTDNADAIRDLRVDLANVSTARMRVVETLTLRGGGG